MNSEVVEREFGLGSDCWKRWSNFDFQLVPASTGVYALRVAGGLAIERVKDASDIIYIGSGKIRARLKAHASPDWTHWDDSGWLISLIAQKRNLEVAWIDLVQERARCLESKILEGYVLDHFELPPANRQMPAFSQKGKGKIVLYSLPHDQRENALRQAVKEGKQVKLW